MSLLRTSLAKNSKNHVVLVDIPQVPDRESKEFIDAPVSHQLSILRFNLKPQHTAAPSDVSGDI
jgi:hypothetical protein